MLYTVHTSNVLFIILNIIMVLSSASQLPSDNRQELDESLRPESISTRMYGIGSMDDVAYQQESYPMTHSDARINCESFNWKLAKLISKAHLEFVVFKALDSSWTSGVTFYTREMYTPELHSTILQNHIIHYQNLALRIDNATVSLFDAPATTYLHSICYLKFSSRSNVTAVVRENVLVGTEKCTGRNGDAVPKASWSFLGIYDGYEYWQDGSARTHSDSRDYCKTVGDGFHLATFDNKGHLDFVIGRGALDYSWTEYTGIVTRDIFRWGDNTPISDDIPINIRTSKLGLYIRTTAKSQLLAADLESIKRPCICRKHVSAE